MEQKSVLLWSQSVQGMSGGKRVHLGEAATWYPQEQVVRIRSWGPSIRRSPASTIRAGCRAPACPGCATGAATRHTRPMCRA